VRSAGKYGYVSGTWTRCRPPIPPLSYLSFSSRINEAFFNRAHATAGGTDKYVRAQLPGITLDTPVLGNGTPDDGGRVGDGQEVELDVQ